MSEAAREYAEFQHLEIHPVGDLLDWLSQSPTKLVCVGDPDALDGVEQRAKAHFGARMYISKSLPYFLEFAAPGVTKGAGLDFLAEHMGFTRAETVAFGDGENDVELVDGRGTASRSPTRTTASRRLPTGSRRARRTKGSHR